MLHKGFVLHKSVLLDKRFAPHPRMLRTALLVLLMSGLLHGTRPRLARALPADFSDTLLATLDYPTALAFTPDGRMLITTQVGRMFVYQNNALLATPALDLTALTCSDAERGMLGVAVDPDFASTR